MVNHNKGKTLLSLYGLIGLGFFIFLSVMLVTVVKPRHLPSKYAKESSRAQRGSIISADGFHLATTKKLYKAVVDTRYIDPEKKELFLELFSIYSGISKEKIDKKISKRRGVVVLSYNIPQIQAFYLKKLARELQRFKVFLEIKNKRTGIRSIHGLSLIESGESRIYPYGNLLTPIIGYPHKIEDDGYTSIKGVKGLEKRFDTELSARQDGFSRGNRDVNNYIILNKNSFTKASLDGLDIKLTIPVSLQIKIERMLDSMKKKMEAKQIMIAIMNSTNGNIYVVASSNRFLPKAIKRSDYPSLRSGMIEYSFEPGSVIKPVTFSLLLDKGLINPYDLVNGHNGRFKIGGRKIITDEHRFDWLSAENVIVYSSNIGMAQLSQKLSGYEFHEGLLKFGFSQKSTPDLIYEKVGSIPSAKRLENEIYKATCSYGYGMRANLMQILRAYSAFNNNGRIVYPRIVDELIEDRGTVDKMPYEESVQVIKSSTAQRMKKILIKTVNEGTGKKAITPGLVIGGKTGTAHIVEKGKYVHKYNTAFMGFANDAKHKYTIGVVVVQPKKSHFASQTAVPVFKKAVDIMIEDGYLIPDSDPKVIKKSRSSHKSLH
jgi:cell division protein FtsI (penicillin-binding protein 3)